MVNTHGVHLTFGKHKGTLLTRVPIGYIRWMINQPDLDPQWKELARSEFERRGDTMPQIELTGHAIDNASLRVRAIWHRTRREEEGLYTWLTRMTLEAIAKGEKKPGDDDAYIYEEMKFVIQPGEEYPVLKTIMPAKKFKRVNPHATDKEEYFATNTFEI